MALLLATKPRLVGIAACSLLSAWQAGCDPQPPTPRETVAPPRAAAEAIIEAPLSGTLRGHPFEVGDMRYTVFREPGRERVDIKLSAARSSQPCGPLEPPDAPSVWLRLGGTTELKPGEHRCDPKAEQGALEVHYQLQQSGRWAGNGDSAALVVIGRVQAGVRVDGALAACFADGQKSCVEGSFAASYCPDPVEPPLRKLGTKEADAAPRKKTPKK